MFVDVGVPGSGFDSFGSLASCGEWAYKGLVIHVVDEEYGALFYLLYFVFVCVGACVVSFAQALSECCVVAE